MLSVSYYPSLSLFPKPSLREVLIICILCVNVFVASCRWYFHTLWQYSSKGLFFCISYWLELSDIILMCSSFAFWIIRKTPTFSGSFKVPHFFQSLGSSLCIYSFYYSHWLACFYLLAETLIKRHVFAFYSSTSVSNLLLFIVLSVRTVKSLGIEGSLASVIGSRYCS